MDGAQLARDLERLTMGVKPATVIVLIVASLLAATAASLVTQAVAAGVRRTWTARCPKRLIMWRADHSTAALTRYRPARLTPIGDRFRLTDERIDV
ncbi:hypothetical protein [Amycolatopsis sp. FDAARGOS 1241]|uniref:hypothetical protein n=1 Tax=Amycolatopsis sp. FDAARGOS 1241 TaxID=2778070 RepID=UPI001951524F|nr:hypothetical protein [Amycolatopsis sp. FDAARGOS 1241]QRP43074.1 hypothetical protein I6J71_26990 [Amycolatopsis sp. FDAARGOS 1241]